MGTDQTHQSTAARKSAHWRDRMKAQGQRTFRLQLPRSVYDQIIRIKGEEKIGSLGQTIDQIVSTAAKHVTPTQLAMPLVVPKTEAVHDMTTVLSAESIAYLTQIKTELGFPRAKAIHAILLTKMEATGRKPSMTETAFLETRFQILSGRYAPGNILDREAMADAFGCSSRTILEAVSLLRAEGYLEIPKRGMFAVRVWDDYQLHDFFGAWATFVAMAAKRATERASAHDLAAAVARLSKPESFDFNAAESTERHALEFAVFNADLMRLSQSEPLLKISREFVPNGLLRKGIFASSAKQLMGDRKSLEIVGRHILNREPTQASTATEKLILRPLPNLLRAAAKKPNGNNGAVFKRVAGHINRKGCEFGLGGREPTLEGVVLPYGIPLAGFR